MSQQALASLACWPSRSTHATESMLGNFPQAFSHVGLINAAWSIEQAIRHDDQRR